MDQKIDSNDIEIDRRFLLDNSPAIIDLLLNSSGFYFIIVETNNKLKILNSKSRDIFFKKNNFDCFLNHILSLNISETEISFKDNKNKNIVIRWKIINHENFTLLLGLEITPLTQNLWVIFHKKQIKYHY